MAEKRKSLESEKSARKNTRVLNEDAEELLNERMKKDRKKLSLASLSASFPAFLMSLLIYLPISLVILLPFAIISQLFLFITKPCKPKKKAQKNDDDDNDYKPPSLNRKDSGMTGRQYDLVVYGATGFTGRLAAIYITEHYGLKDFKWAIAGRRKDALEKIRDELALKDPALKNLPIIIADSSNPEQLRAMVLSTNVIITTTGPYAKYGSKLVKMCSLLGTHYCDITGESDWVREMIDKYDDNAKISGARIVHMCGHDCIPWDLSVMACANYLKSKGENMVEVNCYDELRGTFSGGTLATLFHSLEDRVPYKASLGFDPLVKKENGEKSVAKYKVENQTMLGYSNQIKKWVGFFVMAPVMANTIRRSNALNNYGSKLTYREKKVYPSFFAGFSDYVGLLMMGLVFASPLLTTLLLKTPLLPNPGEGPSEESMDKAFLKVSAYGKGDKGTVVKSVFYCPTDPGYRDTARMLVESGLVLALELDKVKVGGGSWTTASCQGEVLVNRLVESGSDVFTYEIEKK